MAANVWLDAPAGTVTEVGTVIALPPLARLTSSPPLGAAEDNVTVQVSLPAPVMDVLAHCRPDRAAVVEDAPLP